ncbi:MAG: hypothetical protein K2P81_05420 [Bacteriovoracaceae bacterium]|nr:hypothetical protein [Bacteriovoracaceae bacterium]
MSELSALVIAEASLRANILELSSGKFLTAGQNQFHTLWTRDFCHASRGLFAIGESEVVKNHLSKLIHSLRADGLVPRVLDNRLVQWRVSYQTARRMMPFLPKLSLGEPLKPQYTDEHGSHAIDSNLLFLIAALKLKEVDANWWNENQEKLKLIWHWYEGKKKEGLIYQAAFADWQDSVKRVGTSFLTNFYYFIVASRLKSCGWDIQIDLEELKGKLKTIFFDDKSKLYRSMPDHERVSLDGNLLAIEAEEFLNEEEKKSLWSALKSHPLTQLDGGQIGRCSYPEWPRKDVAMHVKFAGLERYHGGLAWSWLVGLGLKIAILRQDQQMIEKLKNKIHGLLLRDGEVVELYDPENMWLPWNSWLIDSERPFAWGAGYLTEALMLHKL